MSDSLAIYLSYYTALVSLLRPAIVTVIGIGFWIALRRTRLTSDAQLTTWFAVVIPLVTWLAIIWSIAATGALQARPDAFPLLFFSLVLPVAIGLVLLTRSARIAAAVDTASPGWLIGLQVYRVFGGNFVVLWALGGAIPGLFALPAGFGDILVGALALPVAFYVASDAVGRRLTGVAWNILGITDLVLAVSLGILSSPGPFQIIAHDQPNVLATTYPTVMTPAFSVPLSLILHGLSLWQLWRRGGLHERLTFAPAK